MARGERQEMVRMLSDEGMSTRAIAPIVGADQKTVSNDIRKVREEFSSPVDPIPHETTGRDGKTYTQPAPVQFDPDPETVQPKPRAGGSTVESAKHRHADNVGLITCAVEFAGQNGSKVLSNAK